ncbi:hypothetical protein Ahia01_000183900 [Argonauta hians]
MLHRICFNSVLFGAILIAFKCPLLYCINNRNSSGSSNNSRSKSNSSSNNSSNKSITHNITTIHYSNNNNNSKNYLKNNSKNYDSNIPNIIRSRRRRKRSDTMSRRKRKLRVTGTVTSKDFVSITTNRHGERDIRIVYRNIYIHELSIPDDHQYQLKLRRLANSFRYVKSVYKKGNLRSCDYSRNTSEITSFISEFDKYSNRKNSEQFFTLYKPLKDPNRLLKQDINHYTSSLKHIRDVINGGTIVYIPNKTDYYNRYNFTGQSYLERTSPVTWHNGSEGDSFITVKVNLKSESRACRSLYKFVRKMTRHRKNVKQNLDLVDDRIDSHKSKVKTTSHNHGAKHVTIAKRVDRGKDVSPPSLSMSTSLWTSNNKSLGKESNHHDQKTDKNVTHSRRRQRRHLNPVLMYPGTKWCGNGNTAEAFDDLGSETEADYCCREHDYCPFTIESFSRRFNLFNYRLHTLSHCQCDRRFRNCLKKVSSNSSITHLIGRIYFDFLGSRCFVFIKEKYCVERSWWGKCRTYGTQLTAKIKLQECY